SALKSSAVEAVSQFLAVVEQPVPESLDGLVCAPGGAFDDFGGDFRVDGDAGEGRGFCALDLLNSGPRVAQPRLGVLCGVLADVLADDVALGVYEAVGGAGGRLGLRRFSAKSISALGYIADALVQ